MGCRSRPCFINSSHTASFDGETMTGGTGGFLSKLTYPTIALVMNLIARGLTFPCRLALDISFHRSVLQRINHLGVALTLRNDGSAATELRSLTERMSGIQACCIETTWTATLVPRNCRVAAYGLYSGGMSAMASFP